MAKPLVLVVDDDESVRRYLSSLLTSIGYDVQTLPSGEKAIASLAVSAAPAVILLDLVMPGMNGLDTLDHIKRSHPAIPVVILSTDGQISTVVEAIRRGASDYLSKSLHDEQFAAALQAVIEKQERPPADVLRARPRAQAGGDGFVSACPRVLRIKEIGRQVADTDAPVLILGPSGVGKEVLARYIHGQSRRAGHAFVKVNCAALPDDLLESELFGYERGAFSGAMTQKPGLFELADGGTILLDEIGEMSVRLQAKLLHVLQDGEFTRLGGRHVVRVDARVMASTNVRLDEAVAAGRFREDVFFRLNVIRVELPPLRDRREDIGPLSAHFLRQYAARYKSPARELPRTLLEAFYRHHWPGNVRELENAVRRFLILGDAEATLAELRRSPGPADAEGAPTAAEHVRREEEAEGVSLRKVGARAAEDAERKLLARVLSDTRWNRREAASQLKISYKALLNKLKKWEVDDPLPTVARGPGEVRPARRGPIGLAAVSPLPARPRRERVPAAEEPVALIREDGLIDEGRWPLPAIR
jgi:two-component system, NtrC family, response regulator AtoC